MGASPGPSTGAGASVAPSSSPAASTEPGGNAAPDLDDPWANLGRGAFRDDCAFGPFGGAPGGPVIGCLGGVEITAIDGDELDLETVDG